jgi:hypothetical protein
MSSSSRRSSYPKQSGLSSYGSNSSIASSTTNDGSSHLHSCSIRLDVKLFFSKRKYWEHQKLDYTRLLYKLLGQSVPDLCQSLYPQMAHLSKPPLATGTNSTVISKADVDRIRQMILRETTTIAQTSSSQHSDGITGRSGGSDLKGDDAPTQKYSDILGGGSVAGMSKNMSHIRGLREKPPAGTYMSKHGAATQRQTSRAAASSSSIGSGATSTASSLSQRSKNRRSSTGSAGFRSR